MEAELAVDSPMRRNNFSLSALGALLLSLLVSGVLGWTIVTVSGHEKAIADHAARIAGLKESIDQLRADVHDGLIDIKQEIRRAK